MVLIRISGSDGDFRSPLHIVSINLNKVICKHVVHTETRKGDDVASLNTHSPGEPFIFTSVPVKP